MGGCASTARPGGGTRVCAEICCARRRPEPDRCLTALRVVIAEDNYLVREGTRRLLEDSGEVEVAGRRRHGRRAAATRCDGCAPDAVLTDIRMPPGHHMEGIEAAHAIRAEHPGDRRGRAVPAHRRDATRWRCSATARPALAYLLKDRLGDVDDLVHALREVAAGGSVIDPAVVEALVRRHTRTPRPRWPR